MRYQISGLGWPVSQNGVARLLEPGTIVDDGEDEWAWLRPYDPPQDCIALTQDTYDRLLAIGYPKHLLRAGPGVVSGAPALVQRNQDEDWRNRDVWLKG